MWFGWVVIFIFVNVFEMIELGVFICVFKLGWCCMVCFVSVNWIKVISFWMKLEVFMGEVKFIGVVISVCEDISCCKCCDNFCLFILGVSFFVLFFILLIVFMFLLVIFLFVFELVRLVGLFEIIGGIFVFLFCVVVSCVVILFSKLFDKFLVCVFNVCVREVNDIREGLFLLFFFCVLIVLGDMVFFLLVRDVFVVVSSCLLEGLGGLINVLLDILSCEGFVLSVLRFFRCCKILLKCWVLCVWEVLLLGGNFLFLIIVMSWFNVWLVLFVWFNNIWESVLIVLCIFVFLSDVGVVVFRFVMDEEVLSELFFVMVLSFFVVIFGNCVRLSLFICFRFKVGVEREGVLFCGKFICNNVFCCVVWIESLLFVKVKVESIFNVLVLVLEFFNIVLSCGGLFKLCLIVMLFCLRVLEISCCCKLVFIFLWVIVVKLLWLVFGVVFLLEKFWEICKVILLLFVWFSFIMICWLISFWSVVFVVLFSFLVFMFVRGIFMFLVVVRMSCLKFLFFVEIDSWFLSVMVVLFVVSVCVMVFSNLVLLGVDNDVFCWNKFVERSIVDWVFNWFWEVFWIFFVFGFEIWFEVWGRRVICVLWIVCLESLVLIFVGKVMCNIWVIDGVKFDDLLFDVIVIDSICLGKCLIIIFVVLFKMVVCESVVLVIRGVVFWFDFWVVVFVDDKVVEIGDVGLVVWFRVVVNRDDSGVVIIEILVMLCFFLFIWV